MKGTESVRCTYFIERKFLGKISSAELVSNLVKNHQKTGSRESGDAKSAGGKGNLEEQVMGGIL